MVIVFKYFHAHGFGTKMATHSGGIFEKFEIVGLSGTSGGAIYALLGPVRPSGSNGEKNTAKQISLIGYHYFTAVGQN